MDEPVIGEAVSDGESAWSQNPRTLLIIGAVAFALLGLLALASAIDLPSNDSADEPPDRTEDSGFNTDGGIDLGDGGAVDIRPIPGCPDGFSIGDNIYVVPDPEACGFTPVEPGDQGVDPNGRILLVPSEDGDIGGFRIGPNGEIDFLPPGVLGPSDFGITQFPDGSFGLTRPDGSRVEIAPGDDGLSMRDRLNGGSQFVPGGEGNTFGQGGQGEQGAPFNPLPPGATQPDDTQPDSSQSASSDDGDGIDWSFLGPVLLVVFALVLVGFLIMALRNGDWRNDDDDDDEATEEDFQDTLVDYSVELNALDQLLWEIDQEADPRTAIRRVYAALETGLDNPLMARKRSETPGIYLRRILGRFVALEAPLQDLTDLFEQARFSEHEITPEMRDRAVTTLVAVRSHYARASASAAEPVLSMP